MPGDSKYCDQCGVEILRCVNCGAPGVEDFCNECGKPMVSFSPSGISSSSSMQPQSSKPADMETDTELSASANSALSGAGNNIMDKTMGSARRKSTVLQARVGNIIIRPEENALIGRSGSPYAPLLSSLNLISRSHAKFLKQGRDWFIMDLGSTNGTYVNDRELSPNVPVKISIGDVVDLGTYLFDVIEI